MNGSDGHLRRVIREEIDTYAFPAIAAEMDRREGLLRQDLATKLRSLVATRREMLAEQRVVIAESHALLQFVRTKQDRHAKN